MANSFTLENYSYLFLYGEMQMLSRQELRELARHSNRVTPRNRTIVPEIGES